MARSKWAHAWLRGHMGTTGVSPAGAPLFSLPSMGVNWGTPAGLHASLVRGALAEAIKFLEAATSMQGDTAQHRDSVGPLDLPFN